MRQCKYAASLLATVLVVAGLSRPAQAGDEVPFEGTLEGIRVSFVPLDPPFNRTTVVVAGEATQLGKYDLVITAVANTQAMTAEGTYEFVAANGDTLTAEFTGVGSPTGTPGVALRTETATITGGTGRFADASGSFEVVRLFDMTTLRTIGAFEGTISRPGKP